MSALLMRSRQKRPIRRGRSQQRGAIVSDALEGNINAGNRIEDAETSLASFAAARLEPDCNIMAARKTRRK
jgi:hypothetical protein